MAALTVGFPVIGIVTSAGVGIAAFVGWRKTGWKFLIAVIAASACIALASLAVTTALYGVSDVEVETTVVTSDS
jgi:CHASE2 domain-containing sensor protein